MDNEPLELLNIEKVTDRYKFNYGNSRLLSGLFAVKNYRLITRAKKQKSPTDEGEATRAMLLAIVNAVKRLPFL